MVKQGSAGPGSSPLNSFFTYFKKNSHNGDNVDVDLPRIVSYFG